MAIYEHPQRLGLGVSALRTALTSREAAPVEAALVQHLFVQARSGIIASLGVAGGVAFVVWSASAAPSILAWWLLLMAISAGRLVHVHRYGRVERPEPRRWARLFLAGAAANGLAWGAVTPLFMSLVSPPQQVLLMMVVTGLCAGAIPSLASVLRVYLVFIAAILVPTALWFMLHPSSPGLVLGPMLMVYGAMMTSTGRNYAMSLVRSYRLAEEKAVLVAELRRAKTHVDAANRELRYEVSHDALTGLVNRREFARRLHRLATPGEHGPLRHALLYLDLDQFKVVNDTCGHTAGDELLKQVAATLQQVLGEDGTLARLGGDEFGILLNRCTVEEAERRAWALRDAVEAFRFRWGERTFTLGVSIGLVTGGGRVELAESALRVADAACLAAKEGGGHRVHVYHPRDENMLRRSDEMRWVTHLGEALDEDRLELYAQPIRALNGSSGTGNRFELLLRLREKDGRVVGPAAFLPAAERYGFSVHIDRWVVKRLFRWADRHPQYLRRIDVCSVNLSGSSLGDAEFLEGLVRRIADGPFLPSQLCFEITETAAIGNVANALRFIGQLRQVGCTFALDDFGSGLSSLGYLKSLPVDYLKIDGLFVRNIADDPTDRAMVKVISEIGDVMGLRTVAEFVENERVLATLEEIGIDYAQGYHIGMPVPLEQVFS